MEKALEARRILWVHRPCHVFVVIRLLPFFLFKGTIICRNLSTPLERSQKPNETSRIGSPQPDAPLSDALDATQAYQPLLLKSRGVPALSAFICRMYIGLAERSATLAMLGGVQVRYHSFGVDLYFQQLSKSTHIASRAQRSPLSATSSYGRCWRLPPAPDAEGPPDSVPRSQLESRRKPFGFGRSCRRAHDVYSGFVWRPSFSVPIHPITLLSPLPPRTLSSVIHQLLLSCLLTA